VQFFYALTQPQPVAGLLIHFPNDDASDIRSALNERRFSSARSGEAVMAIEAAVLPLMHSARQSVSRTPVLLDVIASPFVATLASDDAVLFGSSAEATASDGGAALLVSDDDEPPSAARSASSSRWYSSAAISNASRSLDFVIAAANRGPFNLGEQEFHASPHGLTGDFRSPNRDQCYSNKKVSSATCGTCLVGTRAMALRLFLVGKRRIK
jgi:hypothetical protein